MIGKCLQESDRAHVTSQHVGIAKEMIVCEAIEEVSEFIALKFLTLKVLVTASRDNVRQPQTAPGVEQRNCQQTQCDSRVAQN